MRQIDESIREINEKMKFINEYEKNLPKRIVKLKPSKRLMDSEYFRNEANWLTNEVKFSPFFYYR